MPASLAALVAYAALAVVGLGHPVLGDLDGSYLGLGNDPEIFVWALGWWPHAIGDAINPFVTHAIWAPSGVNLTWTTSVPGAALLLAPVTVLAGSVAAYNLAVLLCPALAAWGAFLLCRHVTRAGWPSFAGGLLFGFSPALMGQELGHLHMMLVFPIPFIALVALRCIEGELNVRAAAIRLGPLFLLQFLFSTELALTVAIAGAAALAIGWWLAPGSRTRIGCTIRASLWGAGGAALLASPWLVYAATGFERESLNSPFVFSADLVNLAVPTPLALVGGDLLEPVSRHFRGNLAENGAYLGLPLLAIVALYARAAWRTPRGRLVLALLAAAVVASLGPVLRVLGVPVAPLPWLAVVWLPPFNNVLPVRLMTFAFLVLAVLLALWLSERRDGRGWRWALAVLALLAVAPDLGSSVWHAPSSEPAYVASGRAERELAGRRVLALPYANRGHSMLWQARADYAFDQAGGYVTPEPPPPFRDDPAVAALLLERPADAAAQAEVRRFVREKGVDAIVLDARSEAEYAPLLAGLGVAPERTGGVLLYRLDGAA